ncbi:hypothetical protein QF049_003127 [Paenibacillus sp. W4I10]|uniref:hypothetical protein n=1 Tax=Paenibacillus sp. W4I10 TaxID=3042298 RepID=UPI002783756F|nr:hypothetical protein [Paenibacillus sp. W4I10]MDQ0721866.1 hypothetical protein [Paenibacillus sp. W4I10]
MSNQSIELLQRLKSLSGPFPTWDTGQLPERPGKLFLEWLRLAVENEVKETSCHDDLYRGSRRLS